MLVTSIEKMLDTLIPVLGYMSIFALVEILTLVHTCQNKKLASLAVTAVHASVCSALGYYYTCYSDMRLIGILRWWSIVYFAYDSMNHIKKINILLLGHHIASILVFYFFLPISADDLDGGLIVIGIWASELGNFSVYNVCYKMYTNQKVKKKDLFWEAYAFLVWRNIVGIMIMCYATSMNVRNITFSFWAVSIWWGIGVARQIWKC